MEGDNELTISWVPLGHVVKPGDASTIPRQPRDLPVEEAEMGHATELGFNNILNSKLSLDQYDIITLSRFSHMDRLQFSLDNRYVGTIMGQFKSLFEYIKPIKVDKRFIHKFRHNHSQIDFVQWGLDSFFSAVIVHNPDIEIQYLMSPIMKVVPLTLSQVEIAFDFYPDDPYDLWELRRVLTDGLILKHSRAGCYSKIEGTEYIGKGGNVRKGAKGVRLYNKFSDGLQFLRLELQFNRAFIKNHGISLPVHADRFNLFDFVDYREPLEEYRLLKLLHKRWRRPVKRPADVEMIRTLEWSMMRNWISTMIAGRIHKRPVVDQISQFKLPLKKMNLNHRVNEFFPKSPKKALIQEDLQKGFVQRKY